MINSLVIEGRLTQNAILKTAGSSILTSFCLANDQSYKKNGEICKKTCFINCEIWGEYGNAIREYLLKGQKVVVQGKLNQDNWQDSEGNNKSTFKIRVNELSIQFDKKQNNPQESSKSFHALSSIDDHSIDFPPEDNPFSS